MKESNLRVIAISAVLLLVAVVAIGQMILQRLDRIALLAEQQKKARQKEQVVPVVKKNDSIHRAEAPSRGRTATTQRVILRSPSATVSKSTGDAVPAAPQDDASPPSENKVSSQASDKYVLIAPSLPKPLFVGTPKNIGSMKLQDSWDGRDDGILVPKGTQILSTNMPVSSSDSTPVIGELALITDGDKEGLDGSYVELASGSQWVQIDLGAEYPVYAVAVWHYHADPRVYHDVAIVLSKDKDCATSTVIFNNDKDDTLGLGKGTDKGYIETYKGLIRRADGISARYVRLYSNGSNANEMNHYIEVEVYGLSGISARL